MWKLWRRLTPLAALLVIVTMAPPAYGAVSVSRAEVSGTQLRVEGTATANRSITVDGVAMGNSDGSGRFKISRSGYTSPADCTIDVNDGSATPRSATLRGCTVSTPPPTTSPQITPVGAELGPGFVGSDFTTFSTTTTTLTFGPDALGPVHFEVVAGQLPADLQLVDQNDGSSPNKRVNASVVGTPTTAQTTSFTARATDANGLTATRTYSITINPARTLEIVPQTWAALAVGEFSNLWIDGKGGVRPYTWVRTAGQFPPGMSLVQDNPDGPLVRVTGTPTTAGTFTFALRLTDAAGATVSRSFTVTVPEPDTSNPPAAPTLLAPAGGAAVTTPFTIDWTEEFDPTLSANGGYNWQVSTTSTFSTLALSDSTLPSVTQDTISGIPNGTYFWRVQAVDGQLRSSPFSAPSSFTVTGTSTSQPGTSVLRLPAYGDSFHPFESFELFWTAADRAVRYELLASKDSTFAAGSIKVDNITGTSDGLTIGDFCGGCEQGTYFARVSAFDADGNRGLPSNTVTFTISYDAPLPPPPSAVSPVGGETTALPVTLDWTDVPNPQDLGYDIEISTSSSFANPEVQSRTTASQSRVLSLTPGTKFWRVHAVQGNSGPDTAAVTDWSTPASFTVPDGAVGVQSVWLGGPPCQDPCPGTEFLNSGQEIEVSLQLTGAAPAGGAVVSLSADKPSAAGQFPATVTVPAGAAFTTFRLFAGEVTEPTPVTLTATLGSSSDSTVYTVLPPTVKRLSFCCDSTGGLPAGAHLEFTGKVPAGGAVVNLSSDSPLAEPPATVTVAAGSFSTGISIPTNEVSATTTVTISASWNGATVTAALKLYPQQPPTSLVLDRTETNGTQGAGGVVRIATGQEHEVLMRITSSHPGIAKPQPYAQIGFLGTAGSFSINTEPPATSTEVTISATGAGVTISTTLTVHPVGGPTGGASISTLALDPTSVTGGDPSTGTVTLSAAAPAGGAVVSLSSGNTAAATVPASVTVPAGGTSADFTVTSRAVTAQATAQITGVYGGLARSAALTVRPAAAPAPSISAVSLSPTTVTGGASSTGTVTLTSAAPAGGASVSLSSSNTAAATVPTAVAVPAGATSATFQATSRSVTSTTSSTIGATFGGATRTAVLTVNPAAQTTDSVAVQRAEYGSGRLRVEATSTSSTVTLRVSVTSTGALVGTLTNDGGGRYRGELSWPSNPQNITVTSSGGGSATRSVTLK